MGGQERGTTGWGRYGRSGTGNDRARTLWEVRNGERQGADAMGGQERGTTGRGRYGRAGTENDRARTLRATPSRQLRCGGRPFELWWQPSVGSQHPSSDPFGTDSRRPKEAPRSPGRLVELLRRLGHCPPRMDSGQGPGALHFTQLQGATRGQAGQAEARQVSLRRVKGSG